MRTEEEIRERLKQVLIDSNCLEKEPLCTTHMEALIEGEILTLRWILKENN